MSVKLECVNAQIEAGAPMGNQNAAKNSPESIEHGKKLRSEAESASHDAHEVSYGSKAVRDENGLIPVEKMTEEHHRAVAAAEKNAAEKWESVRQHAKENGNRATASIASQKRTNHNSNYWVAKKWAGEVKKFGHIQASAAVKSQSLNAGNAMTKKQHLDSCNAAMAATTTANEKNTADHHSIAASHHRIAAEKSKLMGKDDLFQKHSQMASAHDAAAARLEAASTEKNTVKEPDGYAEAISACSESTMPCPHCKKDVDTSEQDGVETGTVECPHCKQKFHTAEHVMQANEAATAYLTKANELSAKRMETKVPLMAGIAGEGLSLNDLNTSVREAIVGLPQFASPAPNSVGCAWVADIVAPEEEKGETWTAIVQGNDQKLYAVEFTIEDESVTIVGEPKLVERVTDYDYVGEIETEAKAEMTQFPLEAGGPGSGPRPNGMGIHKEYTDRANSFSDKASEAMKQAHASGFKSGNYIAQKANEDAAAAHTFAAKQYAEHGGHYNNTSDNQKQKDLISQHKEAADFHNKQARFFKSFNASAATHPDAIEAGDMSDKATKKSAAATALTAEAHEATKNAGDTKDGHTAASAAHKAAFDAHNEAYKAHAKAGSPDAVLEAHMDAMTSHKQHMADHDAKCEACSAKTAADDLTNKVHACHAELQASGLNPSLDDLKHAVFNKHGVLLKQAELANHLSTKLEAGGPGSGPRKGGHPLTKMANDYSDKASRASEMARGDTSHYNAMVEHNSAKDAHQYAASQIRNQKGDEDVAKEHDKQAQYHQDKAEYHKGKSNMFS
jgi:hypothetical protein